MGTPRICYTAPLARQLIGSGAFAADPFTVVDVGASGGIEPHWRQLEPHLHAYGFDPLVKECQRLNREEKNPDVRYFDAFIGAERYPELYPPQVAQDPVLGWSNQPFERTSAARAEKLQTVSYQQRINNDPEVIVTDHRISLDAFFAQRAATSLDFIKIDTDGHDYEVLAGADDVIRRCGVLGLFVECQFHGVTHLHSNLFSNIDRYLRERGFSLFDLEVYRYSRGALPGHFVWRMAAQTREGQVLWGDALYLRDAGAPGYDERWSPGLAPTKLLKLACLFEIYGMPDCAAELLVQRRAALDRYLDVPAALDLLAREIEPASGGFDRLNQRFEHDPADFYPAFGQEGVTTSAQLPQGTRRVLFAVKRRLARYLRNL
jgi:FkbM family methyltransferase